MLRHFYNDFMAFVPLQLPQLLDVTTMEEPQFYGDYVLLTFPLRTPYELDEVMDMFEDDMELITLYHHIPMRTEKFGHSTCAYSNPAFGQMFKMNAKTDTEGNVNSILVTIYDSLEQMYGDLCLDLELHSKSGFLKYKKDKSDVLMNFMGTEIMNVLVEYIQQDIGLCIGVISVCNLIEKLGMALGNIRIIPLLAFHKFQIDEAEIGK